MFTINKANQILEIVLNEYPSLKNEEIRLLSTTTYIQLLGNLFNFYRPQLSSP